MVRVSVAFVLWVSRIKEGYRLLRLCVVIAGVRRIGWCFQRFARLGVLRGRLVWVHLGSGTTERCNFTVVVSVEYE